MPEPRLIRIREVHHFEGAPRVLLSQPKLSAKGCTLVLSRSKSYLEVPTRDGESFRIDVHGTGLGAGMPFIQPLFVGSRKGAEEVYDAEVRKTHWYINTITPAMADHHDRKHVSSRSASSRKNCDGSADSHSTSSAPMQTRNQDGHNDNDEHNDNLLNAQPQRPRERARGASTQAHGTRKTTVQSSSTSSPPSRRQAASTRQKHHKVTKDPTLSNQKGQLQPLELGKRTIARAQHAAAAVVPKGMVDVIKSRAHVVGIISVGAGALDGFATAARVLGATGTVAAGCLSTLQTHVV